MPLASSVYCLLSSHIWFWAYNALSPNELTCKRYANPLGLNFRWAENHFTFLISPNKPNLREEITINFLFIYYVISYAVRVLAQCFVKSKTANIKWISYESNENQQHGYILLLFSHQFLLS